MDKWLNWLWSVGWTYWSIPKSRVTLYTAGHLRTAVPHCSHSRAPIVHTAVPRENNEHGCVYLRCRAVCKLPGCVEGHPCKCQRCSYCSLEMVNWIHPTLFLPCVYLTILGSKLIYVVKMGPQVLFNTTLCIFSIIQCEYLIWMLTYYGSFSIIMFLPR